MFSRIFRNGGIIAVLLILGGLTYWWMHPRGSKIISIGYIAERNAELWDTLAQVRQPLTELHYGDRVEVLRQEGSAVQVRTAAGLLGWLLDSHELMDSTLKDQISNLLLRARAMPVQGRGQTKTVSNVRAEAGPKGQRIFQFMRGTPVVVLARTVADAQRVGDDSSNADKSAGENETPKKEDWLLVLSDGAAVARSTPASVKNSPNSASQASGDPVSSGPIEAAASSLPDVPTSVPAIAGWVLARFIEPQLPGPVRDYASSADLRVVAWFELNRVSNGDGGDAPQYLVAGSRGGEGHSCDFTMLRVYTWGKVRKRYETAFVESDLCGRLPIRVSQTASGPEFRFAQLDGGEPERLYAMHQTSVRRISSKPTASSKSSHQSSKPSTH